MDFSAVVTDFVGCSKLKTDFRLLDDFGLSNSAFLFRTYFILEAYVYKVHSFLSVVDTFRFSFQKKISKNVRFMVSRSVSFLICHFSKFQISIFCSKIVLLEDFGIGE